MLDRSQIVEGFRLSPQQKRLWMLQQRGGAYNTLFAIRMSGSLVVETLRQALHQVIHQQQVFSTIFVHGSGMKFPIQAIADDCKIDFKFIDFAAYSLDRKEREFAELFAAEKQSSFEVSRIPVLRVYLLKFSQTQHILLCNTPALYADGWTIKNFMQRIGTAYHALAKDLSPQEDEIIQYLQFSEWQNEILEDEEAELGKSFWSEKKVGDFPELMLPFEKRLGDRGGFSPGVYTCKIHQETREKIAKIASAYDLNIANVLLACWQILWQRLLQRSDFPISTLFELRNYEELHDVFGLLAKWIPISCPCHSGFTFGEVARQIQEAVEQANQWAEYFVWDDRDTAIAPPIAFEFEQRPDSLQVGEMTFTLDQQFVAFERFKVRLTVVQQADSLIAEFHYDTNCFHAQSIECIAEQFLTLLANVGCSPEAQIGDLNILSEAVRQYLLVERNRTQTDYPRWPGIHRVFEEQVVRVPESVAVVCEDQQLTYRELNHRANQLAHYLQRLGVETETIVGIYLERSLENAIALLGILKAGAAYLPLDPALPPAGLAFRLEDAQVPILLTQQSLVETIPPSDTTVICLDTDWPAIARETQANPIRPVSERNLAYVVYTSGSTGKPKGVAIEHRQLLNYLYGILDRLDLPAPANFAIVSSFATDLGNTAIFPALCTGGCLHILSQACASDPAAFADYCHRHPIDCLKIVPSHLTALLSSAKAASILPRQRLILGGEAASWDLITQVQQSAPNCQIINHYGPTETTVGVLTYPVNADSPRSRTVPIGHPLPNTQVYVLDAQQQPVAIGVSGELYIGGANLGRGYLNRPQLTAQRYCPNPFNPAERLYKTGDIVRYLPDGTLEFLGRTDHQVKLRGFRLELGEIEAVLAQHAAVRQAVVSIREDEPGNQSLVAYLVPSNASSPPTSNDLRKFLQTHLADYMIPSAFVMLKTLPLTPSGKVDRQALPAPEWKRSGSEAAYVAPRTPIERQLAQVWQSLLALEQVGIHDDFFDLGGHSLLVTQLLAQIRAVFQVNLSLPSLLATPTIAEVAKKIEVAVGNVTPTQPDAEESLTQLDADAVLEASIRPPQAVASPLTPPATIFLTGATGFLGAFILAELLQQTDAQIYCLVRATDLDAAKQKLSSCLSSYLLSNAASSPRVIPVVGDLSQLRFGLSEAEYQKLTQEVDAIYHSGAHVNFTYPYSALKAPNVLGTREVIRFAGQGKTKAIHFISTTSVITSGYAQAEVIYESDSIEHGQLPTGGYTQSKWVAERLIASARDRGFPVCIYRPGRVSGHSQTGACNPNDHTFRTIKGCIQLGSSPQRDALVNIAPVDYVSRAIVHLSQQPDSFGKAFHLVNPHPLSWQQLTQFIRAFGYPLRQVSEQQWYAELLRTEQAADNALYPLISNIAISQGDRDSTPPRSANSRLDCTNTRKGLQNTNITCPPVDQQLLNTYLTYLVENGFLNAPQPSAIR